jgi:hypothetical protein
MCYHMTMRRKYLSPNYPHLTTILLLILLVACAPFAPAVTPTLIATVTPTVTPSLTPTVLPTLTPSPTPTATPIPPQKLTIVWPEQVSALEPVSLEVKLQPPHGVQVTSSVRAVVIGPAGQYRWSMDLVPLGRNRYATEEPMQFPLEPPEGQWLLFVIVRSPLEVIGERNLVFLPEPIAFRDLTSVLPPGVDVRVPLSFWEVVTEGDQWAGARVWRYGDGEMGLWWAPGPAEPLLLNNALVMLEATHDPDRPPDVLGVEETEWQGLTAFRFLEDWPGVDGGPAEAIVVQGPDRSLYVLRIRAANSETILPLLRQVRETFALAEGGD